VHKLILQLTVLLFATLPISMVASDADLALEQFRRANKAYESGDFAVAAATYDSIPEDFASFEVHFNAGNAYYRLGQAAPCMWHYEMAALLRPNHDDLGNNKTVAQKLLSDKIEELPVLVTDRFISRLSAPGSLNIMAIISLVLMFVGGVMGIFAFLYKHRRAGFVLVSVVLVCASIGLHLFAGSISNDRAARSGIIWTDRVEVKTAPGAAENAFVIHAGTRVNILRSEGEFREIRLANGHVGWLPAETIKEIKP